MIKKFVLAVLLLLVATNVWAVKTIDVSATDHNLGTSNPEPGYEYRSDNEDEVCIYCHTPHGGTINTPLWNRGLPDQSGANAFTHYTSATLYGVGFSTRNVNTESLLCMSCHDGAVAMNAINNNSNRTGAAPDNTMVMTSWEYWAESGVGKVIGDAPDAAGTAQGRSRDLTDDHPISFNYPTAVAASGGKLDSLANAKVDGVRFFGAAKENVECSSCHDPHVDGNADADYAPFLTMPNTASALCLACHIK